MVMTFELSEAINRHRNDRRFHDVVRRLQYLINDGIIDLKGLKEAIMILEYDAELRKEGTR